MLQNFLIFRYTLDTINRSYNVLKYTKYARYIPIIEYPDPIYPIFSVMCT